MSNDSTPDKAPRVWAREELEKAVEKITSSGVIQSPLFESRPVWFRPFEVVIGQLRDQGVETEFLWVIGGSVPTDYIHSGTAETARDAARHFSMKWQLEAARYESLTERKRLGLDPAVDWEAQSKALVAKAEYLYMFVDDDRLW